MDGMEGNNGLIQIVKNRSSGLVYRKGNAIAIPLNQWFAHDIDSSHVKDNATRITTLCIES
jgi:hypothetical protein